MLMIISFTVLMIVTLIEGRFMYGSVQGHVDGIGQVLGMSYLGDTMVWPFIFIVPLSLLLTKYAAICSKELLNRICGKATEDWKGDNDINGFKDTIESTMSIFRHEYGWSCKLLKSMPWLIAIVFWGYNTTTCAFHQYLPMDIYPYKSKKIIIIQKIEDLSSPLQKDTKNSPPIYLKKKIELPKWDCDLINAPLSTITTRAWTIFFYGLPPFILFRLITIIWGVTNFLLSLKNWESKYENQNKHTIKFAPFGEDGFSGLKYLSDTGMSYLFSIVSFNLLVTMSLFKEGHSPSWHNYIMLMLFLPISIIAFIAPTLAIRRPIMKSKEYYLSIIIDRINVISIRTIEDKNDQSEKLSPGRDDLNYFRLSSLKMLYEHVSSIPEWPFTATTYAKVGLSIFLPIILIIIDKIIQSI